MRKLDILFVVLISFNLLVGWAGGPIASSSEALFDYIKCLSSGSTVATLSSDDVTFADDVTITGEVRANSLGLGAAAPGAVGNLTLDCGNTSLTFGPNATFGDATNDVGIAITGSSNTAYCVWDHSGDIFKFDNKFGCGVLYFNECYHYAGGGAPKFSSGMYTDNNKGISIGGTCSTTTNQLWIKDSGDDVDAPPTNFIAIRYDANADQIVGEKSDGTECVLGDFSPLE